MLDNHQKYHVIQINKLFLNGLRIQVNAGTKFIKTKVERLKQHIEIIKLHAQ